MTYAIKAVTLTSNESEWSLLDINEDYLTSRIIRMREMIEKVGYARSTIYLLVKEGSFPAPFRLTPNGRVIGWLEYTIDQWLSDLKDRNSTKSNSLKESFALAPAQLCKFEL